MKGRCKCCGSNEHKLLEVYTNQHGQIVTVFSCPVSEHGIFSANEQLEQDYLRYRIDAQPFAEHHAYNPTLIEEALQNFETHGVGGHLPPPQPKLLRDEITKICDDVRSSWIFKRSITNMEPSEDEDTQEL